MIRVGIIGGETDSAGELIRILINHPDVELSWVESATLFGKEIANAHFGLVGEISGSFVKEPRLDGVDCVFVCSAETDTAILNAYPLLKIIDLTGGHYTPAPTGDVAAGIPEISRKQIVRQGRVVSIVSAATMAITTPLLPLAKARTIDAPVTVLVRGGDDYDIDTITSIIGYYQGNSIPSITVNTSPNDACPRVVASTIKIATEISRQTAQQLFDEYFDDHNFVFTTSRMPVMEDVLNTNKFIVNINDENGTLTISSLFDKKIKGCAGTAVHVMNLLFGLHERVGLALKAFA